MQRSAPQPRRTAEPQNVHLLLTAATEVDSSASGPDCQSGGASKLCFSPLTAPAASVRILLVLEGFDTMSSVQMCKEWPRHNHRAPHCGDVTLASPHADLLRAFPVAAPGAF